MSIISENGLAKDAQSFFDKTTADNNERRRKETKLAAKELEKEFKKGLRDEVLNGVTLLKETSEGLVFCSEDLAFYNPFYCLVKDVEVWPCLQNANAKYPFADSKEVKNILGIKWKNCPGDHYYVMSTEPGTPGERILKVYRKALGRLQVKYVEEDVQNICKLIRQIIDSADKDLVSENGIMFREAYIPKFRHSVYMARISNAMKLRGFDLLFSQKHNNPDSIKYIGVKVI